MRLTRRLGLQSQRASGRVTCGATMGCDDAHLAHSVGRARRRPDVVAYRRTERDRATDPRAEGAGAPKPRDWT